MLLRRFFLLALLACGLVSSAWALDRPKGRVILTITGQITHTNAPAKAEFDMDMLAALPQRSFTTGTPWYPAPHKFTGPLLRDVLAAVGASGQALVAVALNDYKVSIPFDDSRERDVIIARLFDDQPMSIRDKGPLFIIYPFDSDVELRSERYYSRSAWQLKVLDVR